MSEELQRYLIVNADDFGQSDGVNDGVMAAHERGIVTSASLMVRWPAAAAAVAYGREHPDLSLGLHVDLGEWTHRDDRWQLLYQVVPFDDLEAIDTEVERQLELFRRLTGGDPTHLDSHQHVHRFEPIAEALRDLAQRLGVPLRNCSDAVRYCGAFYGQSGNGHPVPNAIQPAGLIETLMGISPGVTELGCHPGQGDNGHSMYGSERALEVEVLCDPRIRATLEAEDIILCSFRSLPSRSGPVGSATAD